MCVSFPTVGSLRRDSARCVRVSSFSELLSSLRLSARLRLRCTCGFHLTSYPILLPIVWCNGWPVSRWALSAVLIVSPRYPLSVYSSNIDFFRRHLFTSSVSLYSLSGPLNQLLFVCLSGVFLCLLFVGFRVQDHFVTQFCIFLLSYILAILIRIFLFSFCEFVPIKLSSVQVWLQHQVREL